MAPPAHFREVRTEAPPCSPAPPHSPPPSHLTGSDGNGRNLPSEGLLKSHPLPPDRPSFHVSVPRPAMEHANHSCSETPPACLGDHETQTEGQSQEPARPWGARAPGRCWRDHGLAVLQCATGKWVERPSRKDRRSVTRSRRSPGESEGRWWSQGLWVKEVSV